jgi:mannose-6-phosphate isomerase-like protein (cupin superfamily)
MIYPFAMAKRYVLLLGLVVLTVVLMPSSPAIYAQESHSVAASKSQKPGGYVLERDKDVARNEPGTHNGGGETIGYSFFSKTPNLKLVFRKRAFKPGSAIGYHLQREDEIYYVLSGRGMMNVDGKEFEVGPGDAVLTRPGSSHGLKQIGKEDLVILINYEQAPRP